MAWPTKSSGLKMPAVRQFSQPQIHQLLVKVNQKPSLQPKVAASRAMSPSTQYRETQSAYQKVR
jgi:hypothetical protein